MENNSSDEICLIKDQDSRFLNLLYLLQHIVSLNNGSCLWTELISSFIFVDTLIQSTHLSEEEEVLKYHDAVRKDA